MVVNGSRCGHIIPVVYSTLLQRHVVQLEKSKFVEKNPRFFSKLVFSVMRKYFSMRFFKVHLLVKENRFEAVPERFRQFKARKRSGCQKLDACGSHLRSDHDIYSIG